MAYTTDDLFRDNLLGDPNDLDNLVEFRDDANNSDAEAGGDNERGGEGDDKDDEDQEDRKDGDKKPEQKIVRIKRPQPKLDAERLKGPRGLKELRKCMSDVKFRGKGHEAEDLQRIMARMEHWSHRLFPKFQFDDFIEKVEKLGTKKVVQNYVKRMRMGILDDDDDDENRPPKSDDEEAVDNPDPAANETMGEFDRLLAEQVSLHQNNSLNSTRTPGAATPRTPAFPRPGQGASSTPEPTLTPEQRARMEANRLAALERRRVRMEAAAAAAAATAAEVADAAEAADAAAAAEAAEQLSSTTSTTSNSIPVQEAGSEAPREVAGSTEDFNDSSD